MKYSLVVPSMPSDIKLLVTNIYWFFEYLPISKIVVIGPDSLCNILPTDPRIDFMDESELLSYEKVSTLLGQRSDDPLVKKRSGWYLQQFLKMAYALKCKDEYYLLWDSDTIPLQRIEIFDDRGVPYIDYKTEYFKQYFDTMSRLLPGYNKIFSGSFISEHMLINTNHMRELLCQIESNNFVGGMTFYEKIINAIEIKHLSGSGFSEFETFGTFIYKNYRESYSFRRWKSMRNGGFFYTLDNMTDNARLWLAQKYHAISFEKNDNLSVFANIVETRWFMSLFSPQILVLFSFIVKLCRKTKKL